MSTDQDKTYDSPPSDPNDDLWLKQGQKMLESSAADLRDAAKSLMTAIALLKTIYLAILGFADTIPKETHPAAKLIFILPFIAWLIALHRCLLVLMTKGYEVNLRSPDDIRRTHEQILRTKQTNLTQAFYAMMAGLLTTILLVTWCL